MSAPADPHAPPPAWSRHGSGDPRADRRYLFALAALERGDGAAAAEVARQALELSPHWPPAWLLLGEAEQAAGRIEAAAEAYREAAARDPEDILGARLRLGRLAGRAGGAPAAMSRSYVAALFDDYAPRFERHLTDVLGYRGPDEIVRVLAALPDGRDRRWRCALDLGCGTGLMARALEGSAERIEGCDLSAAMVALAGATGRYARVEQADAVSWLRTRPPAAADLVTAADVAVYVGDLGDLFRAAALALAPGGLFALTLQTGPREGYALGDDLRFRHAPSYAARAGFAAGLPVVAEEPFVVRLDRGAPLPGAIVVCRREGP
ncbi:MAG: methyltransferase domain-containing protein [Alsobacter sp.]